MSYNKVGALRFVEENDVKFIRLQFCDILGNLKNISISPNQLSKAFDEGIAFDASSILGFTAIEDSELFLYPDPTTLCILPWRPQHGKVARLFCDIKRADGTPFDGDCRRLTLEQMGFEIESSHHESAFGQHEIDFKYEDVLKSADNILSFKSVVKTIAGRNGLHASFMPKPLTDVSGSGMHINMSLFKNGENIFSSKHDVGLPDIAKYFISGILSHIKEITAVCNPLINSYKRINSGYEAPRHIAWSYKNRSTLIRVPATAEGHNRIELRSPDPTCNPYLALSLILAAGLDGINNQLELPPALIQNAYTLSAEELASFNVDTLPSNLNEALSIMKNSDFVRSVLGDHTFNKYIATKENEWQLYNRTVHDWEIQHYL